MRDSFELASLVSSSSRGGDVNDLGSGSGASSSGGGLSSRPSLGDDGIHSDTTSARLSFATSLAPPLSLSLLPLSVSADRGGLVGGADGGVPLERQKRLGVVAGLALVVGLQIGSGIFSSPSAVDAHAGSPGAALLVWIFAGLLAWTGAASYAELGTAIPLDGGAQAYLRHIFGELPAFLFAWTAITVLKPGSTAIIAIIFGEYVARLFGFASGTGATGAAGATLPWIVAKTVAVAAVVGVTAMNAASNTLSTRAGTVLLAVKIGALLAITAIGFGVLVAGRGHGDGYDDDGSSSGDDYAMSGSLFAGSSTSLGSYAIALYAGLWAFDGWDNLNYVAAEMKNPARDLPKVIHLAMPIVITGYVLANVAYYAVLPAEQIASSNTVALAFGEKVFGRPGALVFALCVALSCFGALNAIAFTSARLVYVAATDGFVPAVFATTSSRTGTPVNALLLQAVLTTLFVVTGGFESLITFYGVAGYVFYFFTVLGVIVLRVREPGLERPYKTFILTPVAFCCVALFLISRGVFSAPVEAAFAALFVAAGVPIYYLRIGVTWRELPLLRRCFGRKTVSSL
ncbi:amino acid permease-domain-containing protein [Limtongia smithiae]|uniref:amino acid permease-domain-containing protein n=1 Tax=Limtongia smithiae TaxID=1125753 RepID=UPI0034CD4A7D